MYSISDAIYLDMAQKLREEIAEFGYFAGVIDLSQTTELGEEVDFTLTLSLIIYRSHYSAPEGDTELISNIVPVWCEDKIFVDGEPRESDFDFDELKKILCQWE